MQTTLQAAERTAAQAGHGPRNAALAALAASGAALGAAFASEWWLGLVPCALCLVERWPYRILIALTLAALLLRGWARRTVFGLAALVALAGAGVGVVHVGVEHRWWPSPLPECAAPNLGGGTVAERLARMPAHPSKPCDDPTYLLPGLPVSMAAMNTLLSLALAGGLAMSASRRPARPLPARPLPAR